MLRWLTVGSHVPATFGEADSRGARGAVDSEDDREERRWGLWAFYSGSSPNFRVVLWMIGRLRCADGF
jgi:hypothetical protein